MAGDALQFVGRGWAFPLASTPAGDVATVTGAEDIDRSIYLILATAPGERPMRPEFGCGLWRYLFEPADETTAGRMAAEVRSSLRRWEPRIEVESVRVDVDGRDPDGVIEIEIDYAIRATYDRRNLVVPFYVIPREE